MSRLLSSCGAVVGLLVLVLPSPGADFLGKSAREWGKTLSDTNQTPQARRAAAFALGKIGADAESELGALIGLIERERNPIVKDAAVNAVGDVVRALGERGKGYWATGGLPLNTALNDPSPTIKRSAAYAIGAFGPEAAPAVPALKAALRDGSASVRQNAAWALGRIGKAVGEDGVTLLCNRLRDDDPLVKRDAATALGEIGLPTAAAAWQPLLDLVQQEAAKGNAADDVLLRTALANLAVLIDNKNKQVASAVNMLMNPNNPEAIRTAGEAVLRNLGAIGLPNAAARREQLLARYKADLEKSDGNAVIATFNEMEQAGKDENTRLRPILAPINDLLRHDDPETARLAAFVLARIGGPLSTPALPVLQRSLNDPERSIQDQAATFLGEMGPDAAPAVDDLAAAVQVGKPALLRAKAAVALMTIGPATSRATPQLLTALAAPDTDDSRQEQVRRYLAEVFLRMHYPNNKDALPDLLDIIMRDENQRVRQACIWAFMQMREADFTALRSKSGTPATDALLSVLDARVEPIVKYDAARCLADILCENTPEKVVEWLIKMLGDESLLIYESTGGNVTGVGMEGTSGTSKVNEKKGGDPRFMAVHSLRKMGMKANRPDVIQALRKAQTDKKDPNGRLASSATELLKTLGQ